MKRSSYDELLFSFFLTYHITPSNIPKEVVEAFVLNNYYITRTNLLKCVNSDVYQNDFVPNQKGYRLVMELWKYLPQGKYPQRNYMIYTPDWVLESESGEIIWIECKNNCGYIGRFKKDPALWNFKKKFISGYCQSTGITFIELRWNQPFRTWDDFSLHYGTQINTRIKAPTEQPKEKTLGRTKKWSYTRIADPFDFKEFRDRLEGNNNYETNYNG